MPTPERIYFLADMHLKPLDAVGRRARELAVVENERLARFLASIEGRASMLVLLGDTFNFWFERRSHVVGDYSAALHLFKLASDSGIDIHHISGNRDYAVGEGLGFDPATRYPGFLKIRKGFTVSRLADFGIEPHGPRFRFHHAGKLVSCVHGDAMCTEDRLFMALRWLLLGPVGRTAMRWSPWFFLDFLVSRLQSRTKIRGGSTSAGEMISDAAVKREMAKGADLLLCGHIHAHHEREVATVGRNGRLVALPAWLDGWYGYLDEGELVVAHFE